MTGKGRRTPQCPWCGHVFTRMMPFLRHCVFVVVNGSDPGVK